MALEAPSSASGMNTLFGPKPTKGMYRVPPTGISVYQSIYIYYYYNTYELINLLLFLLSVAMESCAAGPFPIILVE